MSDSIWLTIALFSVENGKMHFPAGPVHRSQAWCPTRTKCGITVTPLNYFETASDAVAYCGGTTNRICKHCNTA